MARSSRAPRRTALAAAPAPAPAAAPAREPAPRARAAAPSRKPMATARRVSLFERELTVRLSPAALDVLFEAPRVLSEGQVDPDAFVGSTMLTIDLARTADRVSDPADAATARRVAELMPGDEHARARARRIALAEAARSAGDLDHPQVDLRVRAAGAQLHLDLDVEARRKS